MRTLVIGDIHGEYDRLHECLEKAKYEESDLLISLGDVVARGKDSAKCVQTLLNIENKICISGNHDAIFLNWIVDNYKEHKRLEIWDCDNQEMMSCDIETIRSYLQTFEEIPGDHMLFFAQQSTYYVDSNNCLFVHGGFNRHKPIAEQNSAVLHWDRDLWYAAMCYHEKKPINGHIPPPFKIHDKFSEVFIGHTSTINWGVDKPINKGNLWNIDTGCGYRGGRLTIMDVETKEYWQSDKM